MVHTPGLRDWSVL